MGGDEWRDGGIQWRNKGEKETIIPVVQLYAVRSLRKVKEKLTMRKCPQALKVFHKAVCSVPFFHITSDTLGCKQDMLFMSFSAHYVHI